MEHARRQSAKFDPELYEEASSDPYVVFSIDPPRHPGCKFVRAGGYFGRATRTDIQLNTLNPIWEEARLATPPYPCYTPCLLQPLTLLHRSPCYTSYLASPLTT